MIRTQIYLTEEQQFALRRLSAMCGKKQSELIREALDTMIAKLDRSKRKVVLDRVAGMWKDRGDLADLYNVRRTWDRNGSI